MKYVESLRDDHPFIDSVAAAYETIQNDIRQQNPDFNDDEQRLEAFKQNLLLRSECITAILDYITSPENGLDSDEYRRDFANAYHYATVIEGLGKNLTRENYIQYLQNETEAPEEEECPTCPDRNNPSANVTIEEQEAEKVERIFMALDEYFYNFEQAVYKGEYERAYVLKQKIDSAVRSAEQLKLDLREFEHLFIMLENEDVRKIQTEKEREINPQIEEANSDKPMPEPEDYYYDDVREDRAAADFLQEPVFSAEITEIPEEPAVIAEETEEESFNSRMLGRYVEAFDNAVDRDDLPTASIVRDKMNALRDSISKDEEMEIAVYETDFARINAVNLPEFDSAPPPKRPVRPAQNRGQLKPGPFRTGSEYSN